MKTIQKGSDVKRVKDDEAELYVKSRGYQYVPKSVWKEIKNPSKPSEESELKDKNSKGKNKNEKPS